MSAFKLETLAVNLFIGNQFIWPLKGNNGEERLIQNPSSEIILTPPPPLVSDGSPVGNPLVLISAISDFSFALQGENPIFKQATTTFQNPTYGGKWEKKTSIMERKTLAVNILIWEECFYDRLPLFYVWWIDEGPPDWRVK